METASRIGSLSQLLGADSVDVLQDEPTNEALRKGQKGVQYPGVQGDMMTAQNWSIVFKRTAQGIAGLNILMLLVAVVLFIRYSAPEPINKEFWTLIFLSVNAIVYSLLAVLILARHPRHVVGWLFLITGFFMALMVLDTGLVVLALELPIHSELLRSLITLVGELAWVPWLLIPMSLILQFFPDGQLLSQHWWPITALVILSMIGMVVSFTFHPWNAGVGYLQSPNIWSIPGSESFFSQLDQLSQMLWGIGVLGTWIAVGIRFHRSQGIERTQMKWLVFTAGITFLFFALAAPLIQNNSDSPGGAFLITTLFPIGMGIAILYYRFFDIDIVIQRTLVYGILTLLIVVIYIVIVGGLGVMFNAQTNTFSGLVATGIIAILFQPVREHLQRGVRRLLYGKRDDPTAVLAQLAQQMETADSPTDILPNLVHTIAHTLKLPYVAIRLPTSQYQFEPVATWGKSPEQVETIALIYQNETIGHLVVAPRSPGDPFDPQDKQLFNTIAALTANTVRAVQLSDELRQSRQRIVSAREEERRRLRRDLHDGLGPQLASQTLGLEATTRLIDRNPAKAKSLLTSIQKQSETAVADIRRLIYDLRPPTLDDLGLVGALKQTLTNYEGETPCFNFDVDDPLPPLPAAVETAAFHITQEAVTNVVRHAQATTCTIHLYLQGNTLTVAICDDGRGMPAETVSGVGLQSMQERAAELNGRCLIESNPNGGTKVEAWLPLGED